ncbi:MAG: trypsin-like peptidase domain-containing protein, partial [Clostridiales Family XIII bacterium]|nr:trypsin-like peptidase domain-containing protein [Clostridiales Family XIII bacterium]
MSYTPYDVNNSYDGNALVTYSPEAAPESASGRRRRAGRRRAPALALALCVSASTLFGFAGGWLSNQISSDRESARYDERLQALSAQLENALSLPANADGTNAAALPGEAAVPAIDAVLAATETAKPTNVAETAALVKNSVVEISTETAQTFGRLGQYISQGAGSGVVITADGYIVTNYHVIKDARAINVKLADGKDYPASVKGSDAKTDLAVIKINQNGLTPAVQGNSAVLKVGDPAIAVGNPLGELGGTVTAGIISALDREIQIDDETFSLLQTDAAINPGNSGGGLFNMSGELVGVVNAKSSGTEIEGLGFAIPINTAKPVISDLIAYGYVRGRIDTGLTLVDVQNSRTAFMYNV